MRLLPLFLLAALSLYALHSWAHEAELDELGCHREEHTDGYHCHSGQLSGREFMSKDEAQEALNAAEPEVAPEEKLAPSRVPLKVISWNMSKVGTERFEYDRIANVLAEADVAVLQEVEFTKTGETSLLVITDLMRRKSDEKVCKGWFKSEKGERGRHAFVWKESRVGYIGRKGEMLEECGSGPIVFLVEKIDPKESFQATFFLKDKKQMFSIASVQWEAKPKAKEITSRFKKFSAIPTIVVGDFKLAGKDKSFSDARKAGFRSSFDSRKSGNVWFKNVSAIQSEVIDLHDRFPELTKKEIEKGIAGQSPMSAEFSFSEDEAETLKTELIKRPKRDKSSVEEE